jgi:hypothetical protein
MELLSTSDQFGGANGQPPEVFRMIVRHLDRKPGLEGSTCRRTMRPGGIVPERVHLGSSSDGLEPIRSGAKMGIWAACPGMYNGEFNSPP